MIYFYGDAQCVAQKMCSLFWKNFIFCLNDFWANYLRSSSWKVGFKTQFLSHQGVWIITSVVTGTNYSTFNRAIIRVFEMFKNFTLNNNRKEIDITKNGKNFQAPRVQSRSVQTPSVQAFRVQVSTSCIQFQSSFSGMHFVTNTVFFY